MADATLSQGHHVLGLVLKEEDPHTFMQNMHANWGLVQDIGRGKVTQAVVRVALAHFNPYADEKTEPKFFYPEGYKPDGIDEQVSRFLARLDWLDTSHVAEIAATWPEYVQADGLYVRPKPTVVAAKLGIEDVWTNFGLVTEQGPLAALAQSGRAFKNYHVGQMGPEYYRLSQDAKRALVALEARQPGDLLVTPAQTGVLYAGYSVRNARVEIGHARRPAQWPLTSYDVGWMLFANPHRLTRYEDLAIDFPGDEYSWSADGRFGSALYFDFGGGGLEFGSSVVGNAYEDYGSASGFLRQ